MKKTILDMGQWKTRVNELFRMGVSCKWSQEQFGEHTQSRIYEELHRKHGTKNVYSLYMRGYVWGMMEIHRDRIMREEVEFCYLVDGVLYSTLKETEKRKTDDLYKTHDSLYRVLPDMPSGFIWRGTDKVYFGFEPKEPKQ